MDGYESDYLDESPCQILRKRSHDIVLPKPIPGEPERYRLPATQIIRNDFWPRPETVCFRFRARLVSATSTLADHNHPHVLKLHLDLSHTSRFIHRLVDLLPQCARSWVKSVLPEWFLPTDIILKQQKMIGEKEIAKELFDTEVRAYERLKDIQGAVVPIYYGQVRYDGRKALILQDVGGVSLAEPVCATLEVEEFSRLLQECYRALHAFAVHQSDAQCGNFHLIGGRLMALDLEMADFDLPADDNASLWRRVYHT
ncbi:hypothetical protein B0H63DRAFT_513445 [Podospora didyma]|uniref:Uncharacterized protein n=1 Tax=Podospora didyma TaxID=330526 RepID=A0AAE0N737_9PEZI|nr:hypothetical protein B0H63DRAFT_513445 [Podospora didyma]